MKRKIFFIVFFASITHYFGYNVRAQWIKTNGPYGGIINCFASNGNKLYAGSDGDGVFLSTDNGAAWTNIGLKGSIAALSLRDTNIFAVVNGSIYFSSNDGKDWQQRNTGLEKTYILCSVVSGMDIYVGTSGEGFGTEGGIFRSNDNGLKWDQVYQLYQPTSVNVLFTVGTLLFAGTQSPTTKQVGILRSDNNGYSWDNTGLNDQNIFTFGVSGTNIFAGARIGAVFRSTDSGKSWKAANVGLPTSSYVDALISDGTSIFAGMYGNGIYRSTDNGTSWIAVNGGLTNTVIRSLTLNGKNLFAGTTYGGVFRSTDKGSSWTEVNIGLSSTIIHTVSVFDTTLFVGTELQSIYRSSDNGFSWKQINIGSARTVRAFAKIGTNLFAGTNGEGVFRSSDDGLTWKVFNTGLTNLAVLSLAVNGKNLFAGTYGDGNFYNAGVFISTDNGENWKQVSTGLSTNYWILALTATGKNLFAGTSGNGIFLSTNNGENWTGVNNGLTTTYVNTIAVNGINLFAGTSGGGVFFSSDNGTNWKPVNTGLPINAFVQTISASGPNLFTGTESGSVFRSTDNGINWINTGLTVPYVSSFAFSNTNLFVGTRGSCVWRRSLLDFSGVTKEHSEPELEVSLSPNPCNGVGTISFHLNTPGHLRIEVYDAIGQIVETLFDRFEIEGDHSERFDLEKHCAGTYFIYLRTESSMHVKSLIIMR